MGGRCSRGQPEGDAGAGALPGTFSQRGTLQIAGCLPLPVVEETQEVLGADASAVRCTQRSPRIFGPRFADWPDGAPRPSGLTVRTQPYSCVGSCTAQWWAPIPRGSPFPGGAVPDAEGPYILLQFPRRWQ